MSKDVSILWGLVSIKNGADSPTVDKSYSVGTSPLDFIPQHYLTSTTDYFDINSTKTIIKAIEECPQVSTILLRKGQQMANGVTTVTQPNGKPMRGEEGKAWQKLIDRPNVFQTRAEYVALKEMYLWSWGWVAEYKEVVPGFGIKSRRLLFPNRCEIEWKKETMFFCTNKSDLIKSFHYTENGIRTKIEDVENIYFYTLPNFGSTNNGYLPETPLRTLKNPINNSIKNYKSRGRGISSPWGFMSNDSADTVGPKAVDPKQEAEMNRKYRENYGIEDGQSEIIFTKWKMSWQAIMPPVASLQLLELLKSDSAVICDVLGYEYDLLARDIGGVALNNKNEANKLQYQNHTIPHAKDQDQQEAESLGGESNGFILTTDFSHLPVLQADQKAMSEALRNNVQSLIPGFKNSLFSYNDMVLRAGVSELPQNQFTGKWWCDLSDEEKALFENSNSNNENTNGQGNQGNQSGQGQNN